MKYPVWAAGLAGVLGVFVALPAASQVVGIGTTQAGGNFQMGTAIAKVVSEKSGLQMRTQPMSGATQYVPIVSAGQLAFGISSASELSYIMQGKILNEGNPSPNVMMAARIAPFILGNVVVNNGPIKKFADMKGQPVPVGLGANPIGVVTFEGMLATEGVKLSETKGVPFPSFPRVYEAFKQGQIVTSFGVLGAGVVKEFNEVYKNEGGARFLSLKNSPESLEILHRYMPGSYLVPIRPDPRYTGIVEDPTYLLAYDYTLFVGKNVPAETVKKVLQAIYDSESDLLAQGALFEGFSKSKMSQEVGIPYHPGAEAFYKEKGVWPKR
jgi:TRAP transporter TAXI family solute receptor